jgi:hypothetical protein
MRGIYLQLKQFYSVRRIFLHKKSVSLPFSCSIFIFFTLALVFHCFFFSKKSPSKISLSIHCCKMFSDLLPAAPAAALAASEQPSLPTVGTTVAAVRIAAP